MAQKKCQKALKRPKNSKKAEEKARYRQKGRENATKTVREKKNKRTRDSPHMCTELDG